jgi:hypothetical protein
MINVEWTAVGTSNATLAITVLQGQTSTVCLPAPGSATQLAAAGISDDASLQANDTLYVDGSIVSPTIMGRFLCVPTALGPGSHTIIRTVASSSH